MNEPVRRAAEIESPSNLYLIHPLSAFIVPYCARAGITPNQVSLAGMGCGIGAGIAYHFYHATPCVFLGFALMLAWHVLDGADGQLARLTNRFSELGKIIDGVCDYVTFTAVYVGLALTLAQRHGSLVWWVVIFSGICHAVQSAAYELQRQYYNVYALGRTSSSLPDLSRPAPPGPAGWAHYLYTRLQLFIGADAAAFHAKLDHSALTRARYQTVFAPVIRRWSLLSANTRTFAIFLCCLAGTPLLYFLLEILALTPALAALLADQRQRYRAFLAENDPAVSPEHRVGAP